MTTNQSGTEQSADLRYAWYVAVVLMICNTLSFIDRQILGLLVDPIKQDLKLTDIELGALQEVDSKDCFTTGQIAGLQKVYGGVRDSKGKLLYPGQPLGAEIAPPNGRNAWIGSIDGEPGVGLAFGKTFMRFMVRPPLGPDWSYKSFNFDTDYAKLAAISKMIDATSPDLSVLKKRGGKIIHYHGWADALVNPQASVDYYESVLKKIGARQTNEFYKLYMIPGMFHCRGGVGCDDADWFTPLVDWVEKGVAPNVIAGKRVVNNNTVMTRPHRPYPQAAKYQGGGDTSKAENFRCAR